MRNAQRTKHTGSRRHRRVEEAEVILERYFESGLTQRGFAERNALSVSTLQYWLRRAQKLQAQSRGAKTSETKAAELSLLEVELPARQPARAAGAEGVGYEIETLGGERLRLASGFDEEEVRRLLALLREGARRSC